MTRIRAALPIVVSLAVAAGSAHGYCIFGAMTDNLGTKKYSIPVYLVAPNNTIWDLDTAAVAHQLDLAIEMWNEHGYAHFRPYFAGVISAKGGYDGTVYVQATTSPDTCSDGENCAFFRLGVQGRFVGADIYIYNYTPGHWGYTHDDPGTADDTMAQIFLHELGHAWGLKDEYSQKCEPPTVWQSAMAGNCAPGYGRITRRDTAALRAAYGQRQGRYYSWAKSDDAGGSWTYGGTYNGITGFARAGSIGSSVAVGGALYTQTMANVTTPTSQTRAIVGWPPAVPFTAVPWPVVNSRSWDIGGAATRDYQSYAIAYRYNETETNCNKWAMINLTNNNSGSWRNVGITNDDGTLFSSNSEGLAIGYDPNHDAYIVGVFDDNHTLRLQMISAAAPDRRSKLVSFPGIRSYNNAAVACNTYLNTSGTAGLYSCLVAWTSTGRLSSIKFSYFDIAVDSSSSLALQPVHVDGPYDTGFLSTQPPTIAPQDRSDYPWIMTTKLPTAIYSVRYSAAAQFWIDSRVVATAASGLLAGAAGSHYASGQNQLIVQYLVE